MPGAVFICALLFAAGLHAGSPQDLPEIRQAKAIAETGDRLRLKDGAEVLLAGIVAPRGRKEAMAAPLAAAARDALAELIADHTLSVRPVPAGPDRAGRLRAHLLRDDGLWLQADLLRRGLARVALSVDTAVLAPELLAAEAEAREARRGLWGRDAYAVRDAADAERLNEDVGTFQVLAGTVASTARKGDAIYLNFGSDYRADVTAVIPRDAWPAFRKLKPQSLTGHRIEVRGWVARHNGPEVEIAVPEMLTVLDVDSDPPKKVRRRPKGN